MDPGKSVAHDAGTVAKPGCPSTGLAHHESEWSRHWVHTDLPRYAQRWSSHSHFPLPEPWRDPDREQAKRLQRPVRRAFVPEDSSSVQGKICAGVQLPGWPPGDLVCLALLSTAREYPLHSAPF